MMNYTNDMWRRLARSVDAPVQRRWRTRCGLEENVVPDGPARVRKRYEEPELTFRPATAGDYAFALELYLTVTGKLLMQHGLEDRERIIERFTSRFHPADSCIIWLDDQKIGWMQVAGTATGFHLQQIHILEDYRNRGIGTRLIKSLQERARAAGRSVTLNVLHGNPAIALYRRLGFRQFGEDAEKVHMRWAGRRSGKR